MEGLIDLHIHSLYSADGDYTPEKLVNMCRDAGVMTMAISDHNSVRANEEAILVAGPLGIRYIPAVELDCTYRGVDLHVLGYQIEYKSPDFGMAEDNIRKQDRRASLESFDLVRRLGFDITEDELYAVSGEGYWKNVWTGEVFAEVLLHKTEYMDHEMLRPYRQGGSRSDNPYVNFYWDYFSQGKPFYAEMIYPILKDVVAMIKDNGGKVVLAHPGNNLKGRYELLDEIVGFGLDGVEAFTSYHDESVAQHFCSEAQRLGIGVTCGSDFHGKTKPRVCLADGVLPEQLQALRNSSLLLSL